MGDSAVENELAGIAGGDAPDESVVDNVVDGDVSSAGRASSVEGDVPVMETGASGATRSLEGEGALRRSCSLARPGVNVGAEQPVSR